MRTRPATSIVVFVLIAFAALTSACGGQERMDDRAEPTTAGAPDASVTASPGHPVRSPSGAYVVEVEEVESGATAWRIKVRQTSDAAVELAPEEAYSLRSRTFVLWDDDRDRLWVYSGDVGTTFWDRDGSGAWQGHPWYQSGQTAPAFLRSAVPERFG